MTAETTAGPAADPHAALPARPIDPARFTEEAT